MNDDATIIAYWWAGTQAWM